MAGCFCCEGILPEEQPMSLDELREFIWQHNEIKPQIYLN